MTDINLKTLSPDTSLPTTGFLFGADSQASTNPSVYSTQTVATTLLGSTSLTGDTLTASAPVLNLTQTWNNAATTFTGIKFNVTDSGSTSASLLIDIQNGGSSKFNIDKVGQVSIPYGAAINSNYINSAGYSTGTYGNELSGLYQTKMFMQGSGSVGFSAGTGGGGNPTLDTILTRKAAANLRFGAADAASPVAQTLSVQSVVAGTSNTAGATFTITGSQGTGSGAGGSIIFQVAPAGGSGTAQNALAAAMTIASDKSVTFAGALPLTSNSGIVSLDAAGAAFRVYTGSKFTLNVNGNKGACLDSASAFYWTTGSNNTDNPAVGLSLNYDALNTLAQRNSTAAQALNIYNTYTSSTSFERYSVDWITTANLAIVGPNKGSGGGTQRVQRLSYLEDGGAGSTVPLLGSTCPAASGTVKSWIKIITSDGTTAYIPCWA